MRNGIKEFKEFHDLTDWKTYINTFMLNTIEKDSDSEVRIVTGRSETIAVWQKHGYGYIEECRSADRLANQCKSSMSTVS